MTKSECSCTYVILLIVSKQKKGFRLSVNRPTDFTVPFIKVDNLHI